MVCELFPVGVRVIAVRDDGLLCGAIGAALGERVAFVRWSPDATVMARRVAEATTLALPSNAVLPKTG